MTTAVTLLYDDEAMAAVMKPAGVAIVPAPGEPPSACLRDRVASQLGTRAWLVHRLDRDTSGVVLFAKTRDAHRALSVAFERRDVQRRYTAFVRGVPAPPAGVIDVPLHEARKGKARPAHSGEPGGREARTAYAVTGVWRHGGVAVSAVALTPETSRHHQIRVHLRSIGTPIVGDPVYGRTLAAALPADVPPTRLALHAGVIDVPHPSGARRVSVEAPLTDDLRALRAWLDAHWTAEPPT